MNNFKLTKTAKRHTAYIQCGRVCSSMEVFRQSPFQVPIFCSPETPGKRSVRPRFETLPPGMLHRWRWTKAALAGARLPVHHHIISAKLII